MLSVRTLTDERPRNSKVNSLLVSDPCSVHFDITGKGCGKRSSHFQQGDHQDQLRRAEMHNLFSGLQFGGFDELGGSRVLALP